MIISEIGLILIFGPLGRGEKCIKLLKCKKIMFFDILERPHLVTKGYADKFLRLSDTIRVISRGIYQEMA